MEVRAPQIDLMPSSPDYVWEYRRGDKQVFCRAKEERYD